MTDELIKLTIPLPPVTKKNSQQIMFNAKTGKRFIVPSRQYREYESKAVWFCKRCAAGIDRPVEVKCIFFMPTKRRVDLTNLLEAVDDVLVKAGVLADDNCTIIVSHDGSRVVLGDKNPRTEITISEVKRNEN